MYMHPSGERYEGLWHSDRVCGPELVNRGRVDRPSVHHETFAERFCFRVFAKCCTAPSSVCLCVFVPPLITLPFHGS